MYNTPPGTPAVLLFACPLSMTHLTAKEFRLFGHSGMNMSKSTISVSSGVYKVEGYRESV
jgi:hypothetical protein